MPERVSSILARELTAAGFTPDPLLSEVVLVRVHQRGIKEGKQLPPEFSSVSELWPPFTPLLGMGASFTEFLTSGIPADTKTAQQLASLGAVANAIYALGDWLVDSPRAMTALPNNLGDLTSTRSPDSHAQVIGSLTKLYLERVERLGARAPRVKELLVRTLRKLYAAELASANADALTKSVWWRKSALPIFVLGLPAWFAAAEHCKVPYEKHLRWLGATGEFTGWVDDFADYEEDCQSGDANRLKALDRDSILRVATKVAEKGRQVLRFWDQYNKHVTMRNTFTVMIWSWLAIDSRATHSQELAGSGSPLSPFSRLSLSPVVSQ